MADSEIMNFHPTGGGRLLIAPLAIRLNERSSSYGGFNVDIVRPIVERYAAEHLPDRQILVE